MLKMKYSPIIILMLTAMAAMAVLCTPCIASGADNHSTPIPRWLQGYDIRPEFVPVQAEKIGAIQRLQGRVVIIHQATDEAFFGKTGDPIFKKDLIATLADTVCRIQFSSRDTASLGADSILTIEDYLDARSENKKSALLSMKAGRIFFYVLRLLGYRDIDFKVETPSSVAAVRGTKFGLHVYESKDPQTGDAAVFTNCYCADGLIEIDGLLVEPGELYQSVTGEVEPAPATYLNQFHAALNLPAPAPPVVTATRRDRTTDDENRAALAEQNAAHTENIQEVRHLNLAQEEAAPEAQPLPEPEEPPFEEPPMEPREPPVEEPPTQPNEPPVNEPPLEPEEPPFEEPPMEPGEPPVEEPPGEPNQPPVNEPPIEPEEPPMEPGEPPVEGPPAEPNEPPVNEPPMEPEEPPVEPNDPPVEDPPTEPEEPPTEPEEPPTEPEEPPTEPEEPPTEPEEPPTEPEEPPDEDDDDWDDDNDDWDDNDDDDADHDEDRDEDDDDHPGQGKGHQNHDDDHPGQGKGHDKFD